jgi:thiol:disulfide interchange protein DsbC
MSAIDRVRRLRAFARPCALALGLGTLGAAGVAIAAQTGVPTSAQVVSLLQARLPKTQLSRIDCEKVAGLCEVTAGANLFYVDHASRYLIIGRVYDMETRQDLTAARLLEINPDMLVGGAAKANRAADEDEGEPAAELANAPARVQNVSLPRPAKLSLAGLPKEGAIVWGNPAGPTVTIFTDFRCGYCRALTAALRDLNVRVVERPISVLGSRDLANRVYCASDPERALHAAYAGQPLQGAGRSCDTSGLDANEAFARRHGLGGTPVIVRSDGTMLEGYRPREFLQSWLRGARS